MKKILSIAGSDCSGGAGIQADLKTMLANGVYGMSAITALTAQNTTIVSDIMVVDHLFLKKQLERIFEDIFPDAIKIGMVANAKQVDIIATLLKNKNAKNIIVDPVLVSTSGYDLSNKEVIDAAEKQLFPMSDLITPNISEAEVLSNETIKDEKDMETASKIIYNKCHCPVFLKGGHQKSYANDVLYDGTNFTWFKSTRINNPNTHGTGCTLSSAIACNLANDKDLKTSIKDAKSYITNILKSNLNLGSGSGPLDHGYDK